MKYAVVRRTLGRIFDPSGETSGTLDASIKQLSRMGIPAGAKVGRGQKADYDDRDLWTLILVLEMRRLGVPPQAGQEIVSRFWPAIEAAVETRSGITLKAAPRSGVFLDIPGLLTIAGGSLEARRNELTPIGKDGW